MPQLQLPIFPAGVTEINSGIAVQKNGSTVWYLHGHLPVFQHEAADVRGFRMFTSQMIAGETVKPMEIVKTFGVPMVTVKRYVKLPAGCTPGPSPDTANAAPRSACSPRSGLQIVCSR